MIYPLAPPMNQKFIRIISPHTQTKQRQLRTRARVCGGVGGLEKRIVTTPPPSYRSLPKCPGGSAQRGRERVREKERYG